MRPVRRRLVRDPEGRRQPHARQRVRATPGSPRRRWPEAACGARRDRQGRLDPGCAGLAAAGDRARHLVDELRMISAIRSSLMLDDLARHGSAVRGQRVTRARPAREDARRALRTSLCPRTAISIAKPTHLRTQTPSASSDSASIRTVKGISARREFRPVGSGFGTSGRPPKRPLVPLSGTAVASAHAAGNPLSASPSWR